MAKKILYQDNARRALERGMEAHEGLATVFDLNENYRWQEIDGELYWDGGVMENTPILPALNAYSGPAG